VTKQVPILVEPRFGYADRDGLPYEPSFQETLKELARVMNIVSYPYHLLTALNFVLQISTLVLVFVFCLRFLSMSALVFILLLIFFLGTIHNTIWYHRYCSHKAFEFARPAYAILFLWTNPLAFIFREEVYAIPHRIHHQRTEKAGDPYGPHLGWLASCLAPELTQRINPNLSKEHYESIKQTLSHIGLRTHTYAQFKKTGSIESLPYYAGRTIFSQTVWSLFAYLAGGTAYLAAYYCGLFIITFLIRDFNWRGHGGNFRRQKKVGWEFDTKSYALNQRFYGYIASEWHDNHHNYPASANNGFLTRQVDIAFQVIKFMHRMGIVRSYVDAGDKFNKDRFTRSLV
jgi:stearoyl-CoA desaturase (delta-9 desaturase)